MLLGETAVGKSSVVQRYVRDQFTENQESTIGGRERMCRSNRVAAFLSQTIKVDNDIVKFDIWDTAGQERYVFWSEVIGRYHSLAPMYYRGAKAAIVIYDITSRVSVGGDCDSQVTFARAKDWVTELKQNCSAFRLLFTCSEQSRSGDRAGWKQVRPERERTVSLVFSVVERGFQGARRGVR